MGRSHPSRVRGLKYMNAHSYVAHTHVAPFTGAWIEMSTSPMSPGMY